MRGEWVDLPPLDRPVLPELPAGEWQNPVETVATWESWRRDPVTAQWSPSDVQYAMHTIQLVDGMTASNANEVRLRMDGLGLTPKGKRDLRWRVVDGESVADASGNRLTSDNIIELRQRLSS